MMDFASVTKLFVLITAICFCGLGVPCAAADAPERVGDTRSDQPDHRQETARLIWAILDAIKSMSNSQLQPAVN